MGLQLKRDNGLNMSDGVQDMSSLVVQGGEGRCKVAERGELVFSAELELTIWRLFG